MKTITNFRQDARGMYLDLADQPCAIAINRKTRDILLDEGGGPDRYHGAAIFLDSEPCFTLDVRGPRLGVWLIFGKATCKHFLGTTRRAHGAVKWVTEANLLLGQPTRHFYRHQVFRGHTGRVTSTHAKPVHVVLQDKSGTAIEIDGGPSGQPGRWSLQRKTSMKRWANNKVQMGQASIEEGAAPPKPDIVIEQGGRVLHRRRGRKFTIIRTGIVLMDTNDAEQVRKKYGRQRPIGR